MWRGAWHHVAVTLRLLWRDRRDVARLPRIWPRAWAWVIAAGACLGLLVWFASVVGSDADSAIGRTVRRDEVAAAIALVLLITLSVTLRKALMWWLAWYPGPIQVSDLVVSTSVGAPDRDRLTRMLRDRVAQRHLRPVAAVPGAPPSRDVLGMVREGGVDSDTFLGTLARLIAAAIPTYAYEVNATLVSREESPRYRVALEVRQLPHKALPAETRWQPTCVDAIEDAAAAVVAAVLPRTRLCRSPWSGWRRYPMRAALVYAHERASHLTQVRRYDEALKLYYLAIKEDPRNIDLRLQAGNLQEKLGLQLDALAMYLSARKVTEEDDRRLYGRRAIRERQDCRRVVQYRLAVLLAGKTLAAQWRRRPTTDSPTQRDEQRARVRGLVRGPLLEMANAYELDKSPEFGGWYDGALRDLRQEPPREPWRLPTDDKTAEELPDAYRLRALFAALADCELQSVQSDLRLQPWRARRGLSPATVRLARILTSVRMKYIHHRLVGGPTEKWNYEPLVVRQGRRRKTRALERHVGKVGKHGWTDHYNAACLYAIPLLVDAVRRRDEQQLDPLQPSLAERARRSLEKATKSATSAHIASRRDWVISEDPDLAGFRGSKQFKEFEAMYYPPLGRSLERPPSLQTWEMSRYVRELVAETADRWECVWHTRATSPHPDIHDVVAWFRDEAEAWRQVERLACDYRHAQTRISYIDQVREWAVEQGFEPLDATVPCYDESWLDGAEGTAETIAERDVAAADGRLVKLHNALSKARSEDRARSRLSYLDPTTYLPIARRHRADRALPVAFEDWQTTLRHLDEEQRKLMALHLEILCNRHAAAWQRLREWITAGRDDSEADASFLVALDAMAPLWTANALRLAPTVVAYRARRRSGARDRAHNGSPVQPSSN